MTTSTGISMSPRSSRRTTLGAFACIAVTCVVAPPVVRGASDASQSSDGGGCNGGRNVAVDGGDDEMTTTDANSTGDSSETTAEPGSCGDGMKDAGEACDDGNDVEEDSCPSGAVGKCQAAAKCGDGFVWAGMEACDGGEGCEADCTLTPAECGNGVMEPGEGCDDGNVDEEDGCPSGVVGQCKAAASCGDGVVWAGVEGCDDGNVGEEDGCPSGAVGQCKAAATCGDGFVWAEMEGCDDGNVEDTDVCPSGAGVCMAEATCGDGFVRVGAEDCDDMNAEDLDACNNACASPRWVFVTSKNTDSGNLGGVAGADAYCQMFAMNADLPGTYMAWLTGMDPTSAPAARFASTEFKGWYLLPTDPPTPVALGWADLTSPNEDMPGNYLQNAIHADETGKDVGDGSVWTNTNPDGAQNTADSSCMSWSSIDGGSSGVTGRAKDGVVNDKWTINLNDGCNGGNRLYCFQVG